MLFLFLYLTIFSISSQNTQAEIWKDIKPLKTNREQVGKLLGQPKDKDCTICEYQTKTEEIIIFYSTIPCKGILEGWNVPPNTVLRLVITPKKKKNLSELNLDGQDFIGFGTHNLQKYYFNKTTGAFYHFNFRTNDLRYISFDPKEEDNYLRCPCYPPYNPMRRIYHPNYDFEDSDTKNLTFQLDSSYLDGENSKKPYTVYLMVYSGENVTKQRYNTFLKEARKHWDEKRKYPPENLKIIRGGKRNTGFYVNIFLLPKDLPPPIPEPDKPSEYCLNAIKKEF